MYIIKKLNISLFFVLSHTHISLLLLLLLMRWRWLWLEAPRSSLCHTAIKMHSCFNKAIRAHHRFQLIQSFPLRMKLPQNCWDYFSSSAALHWRWCKFIWFLIYTCTCSRVQHTHTPTHTSSGWLLWFFVCYFSCFSSLSSLLISSFLLQVLCIWREVWRRLDSSSVDCCSTLR